MNSFKINYQIVQPPSITMTAPVTYDESSLERNSIREFNSFFFIIRPNGVCFEYFFIKLESCLNFTPPGATQFTRIDGPKCVARYFVKEKNRNRFYKW